MFKLFSRKKPRHVYVYRGVDKKWYWHAISRNGQIVDASEQGYVRRDYAYGKAASYASPYGLTPEYVQEDTKL